MSGVSRRQMLSRSAISIAGVGLLGPGSAFARSSADPRPIPGGFDENFNLVPTGAFFHAGVPGIGFEMSTITDFNGVVGGSEIRGTAHGSDGSSYDFDTDMRFMRGVYVGLDNRVHQGTFGFIWIDLFEPGAVGNPAEQDHDWEPGIASSGLAWTIPIAASSLTVDPGTGEARLAGSSVAVPDFHDGFSAIFGGGPDPIPGHVSFDCRWAGHGEVERVTDDDFTFTGRFVGGPATISFTARNDGDEVVYTSDPDGQHNPGPEENGAGSPAVGHERNGIFF